jgi:hypothetical protein
MSFEESVQKSVAHLDYHVDYQYSNLGVPHVSEHSPFEAMMKAERQEHLMQSTEDKGNGFRQVEAYGRGKMLEL